MKNLHVGDRVLVSCVTACGACRYCREGRYGQCLGGGGWILGNTIDGTQAEFTRIPFADNSTYPAPVGVSDESLLMLADILPTALRGRCAQRRTFDPATWWPSSGLGRSGCRPSLAAVSSTRRTSSPLTSPIPGWTRPSSSGPTSCINNAREDPRQAILGLTDGLGADVSIEAVGVPATFELAATLIRPGGHVANIGVHGEPVTLHLEDLWTKDVTITTGLVDTYSTPTLLRLLRGNQIDAGRFVTHHFKLDDVIAAYDTFSRSAETGALKVVLAS